MKNQGFLIRLSYAINGIRSAFRTEKSFRTQVAFAVLVCIALGIMKAAPIWWALILVCIAGVLAAELFNTALEHFIDQMHPQRHTAIGIAKDCAAGAVLVGSLASVAIFLVFLFERFA